VSRLVYPAINCEFPVHVHCSDMFNLPKVCFCFVGLLAFVTAAPVADDPLSSVQLSEAIDACITRLLGTPKWFHNLKTKYSYVNAMYMTTCTPDEDKWQFPDASTATGLLKRVLETGEIKVAGVKWSSQVADYITNPDAPTGYWAEYMTEIMKIFNAHYGTNVQIKRSYYDTSVIVTQKVHDGVDDMSEPYYYISGFLGDKPRIELFDFSCVTSGTASSFYVSTSSTITTVDELNAEITRLSTTAAPGKLGFIAKGNFDAVSNILAESAAPEYITDGNTLADQVAAGTLLAGYVSEGLPPNDARFRVFTTGIVSPRVVMFRKPVPTCPSQSGVVSSSGASAGSASVVINMFNSGSSGGCK